MFRIPAMLLGALVFVAGAASTSAQYSQPPLGGYGNSINKADLVKALLTAVNPVRREQAARLLGESGDPTVVQALSTAAVYDQDDRVRRAASAALAQIRQATGSGYLRAPGSPGTITIVPPPVAGTADPQYELVQSWYQRYLHRSGNVNELSGWVTLLNRGSPEDVEAGILGSDEFYNNHGGTPEGFVRGLFDEVLHRRPTPQEFQRWVTEASRHLNRRQRVALDFLRTYHAEVANQYGGW